MRGFSTANPLARQQAIENRNKLLRRAGWGLLGATVVGQWMVGGTQKDFYDYRFITKKNPDDLAGFYGGEEFMELFCVLPIVGVIMMRGGHFDDEGTVHSTGLPGELQVSMVFSDGENEDTGQTEWFNKRERFKDVFMGYTCWDMVCNFGFKTLPDGRLMVYHHGEYFKSRFPPISLIMYIVFRIHARWVAWATEHHINHYAFQSRSEAEEEWEEESRADMPLFLLKNYAWTDLMAGLFGRSVEKPSFLVKKGADLAETEEEEDEEETQDIMEAPHPTMAAEVRQQIHADIKLDRKATSEAMDAIIDSAVNKAERTGEELHRHHSVRLQRMRTVDVEHHMREKNKALRRHETSYHAAVREAQDRFVQRRSTIGMMDDEELAHHGYERRRSSTSETALEQNDTSAVAPTATDSATVDEDASGARKA